MNIRPLISLSLILSFGCITNYNHANKGLKNDSSHSLENDSSSNSAAHNLDSNNSSESSQNSNSDSTSQQNGDGNSSSSNNSNNNSQQNGENSNSNENNSNNSSNGNNSNNSNGNNSNNGSNNSSNGNNSNNSSNGNNSQQNGESNNSNENNSNNNSNGNNSQQNEDSDNSSNQNEEHQNNDEESLDCDAEYNDPDPINECLTDDISDGDIIEMSLSGGTTHFNQSIYSQSEWYCSPLYADNYSSPERAFSFNHPGGFHTCNVELESSCDDLTLVVIRWDVDALGCPSYGDTPHTCDWSNDPDDVLKQIQIFDNNPTKYLIIVDSATSATANFKLSVVCD